MNSDKPKDTEEEVWVPADLTAQDRAFMVKMLKSEQKVRAAVSPAELRDQMLSLIQVRYDNALAPAGIRLNELNRRFGVAASRFGTTARDLVIELVESGDVLVRKYRSSVVVLDKAAHEANLSVIKDARNHELAEQVIMDRAFPSPKETPTKESSVNKSSTNRPKARFPWED